MYANMEAANKTGVKGGLLELVNHYQQTKVSPIADVIKVHQILVEATWIDCVCSSMDKHRHI